MIDDVIAAHGRLVDALGTDILAADAGEVLASHPGHEARVVADALRQAIRRGLAAAPDPRMSPRDRRHGSAVSPVPQEEKP